MAFRNLLREATSLFKSCNVPLGRQQATRRMASMTVGQQQHGRMYELRTYTAHPHAFPAFLKLTNECIELRTAHSPLIGYWTVEHGPLAQLVHIWQYEDYAQRTAVRAALAKDPEWQESYIAKVMPMLCSLESEVTYLVPWNKLGEPKKQGGVYELVTFDMKPGGPALWGKAFRAAITTHQHVGYASLIGVWHSEFGKLNRVQVLWNFDSADSRAAGRHLAHEDARVVAAVRESVSYVVAQSNKLLLPTPFSPLK
ncbi:protein NipSnap homolog 3A isoform X1 [Lethenteron reissneri]|uniref:protein NipSnap homolog 3A isoform X1 n=1 Tax=Lethenteron reissneri TaxID=7753 RepID=UPI002AB6C20C|nr:protein NipSnap homolog 3A isoform X1 [Lethenteron reissneri]XP_061404735.1 protein NipSnap homolog 3A isoform X1 [Lethenteron reissneri]